MAKETIKTNLKLSDKVNLVYNGKEVDMTIENFKTYLDTILEPAASVLADAGPLLYKALLSQKAPIPSQTSGTFEVGMLVTIESYDPPTFTTNITNGGTSYLSNLGDATTTGGSGTGFVIGHTQVGGVINGITITSIGTGYQVGDVLTIVGGDNNATFELTAYMFDDFSNWNLISGTGNTNGDVYQVTESAPTSWTRGSDLSYDGSPYVVSTDVNGDLNPFVNTLGEDPVYTYNDVGTYLLTLTSNSISKTNVIVHQSSGYGSGCLFNTRQMLTVPPNDYFEITSGIVDLSYVLYDNILNYTPISIEVYP